MHQKHLSLWCGLHFLWEKIRKSFIWMSLLSWALTCSPYMGHLKLKCFKACAKCADSYHLVHAQCIISPFIHSVIPMSLFVECEGPDQTEQMCTDLGLGCPHMPEDKFLHSMAYIWQPFPTSLPYNVPHLPLWHLVLLMFRIYYQFLSVR